MTHQQRTVPPMDELSLADQLAKADELLYQPCDETWIADTSRIEGDGYIEAGSIMQPYVDRLKAASPEDFKRQRRYMRLLSILLPELKTWLQTWELGRSFESVYTEAQRLTYKHLKHLTSEQETWMEALLAEDEQQPSMEKRTLRSQVVPMLSALFTQEERQALADIAAQGMSEGVLQMVQVKPTPPVAV